MKVLRSWTGLAIAGASLVVAACGGGGTQLGQGQPATEIQAVRLGEPFAELTSGEANSFESGREAFQQVESVEEGLGPIFNARACSECHRSGAIGGSSIELSIARVTRIGGYVGGQYSDLTNLGGPVLEARSLKEINPSFPVGGEVVPANTPFVSHRITTPLFGLGLIEAIPSAAILSRANSAQPDGVHGQANMVRNIGNGKIEVGRFGWKAQISSIHVFSGDAYLNEMGVTSALFPHDNLPQGQSLAGYDDGVDDPEDEDHDVEKSTDFMRFLAPPFPKSNLSATHRLGQELFASTGCATCHVPLMTTGTSPSPALSYKNVRLYSDLLLHHMGSSLADGIEQGQAQGDQFRTAPLWGLSERRFFLHDGRATTVEQAIAFHGGEATTARNRFATLKRESQAAMLEFLKSL